MIETSWLTKHERGVVAAALRDYEAKQQSKARKSATARVRAMSAANAYVANDLIRQLAGR